MFVLKAKPVADQIYASIIERIRNLACRSPAFAIIQIGDNLESNVYISKKKQTAEQIGIKCEHYKFDYDVSFELLKKLVQNLNENNEIDGIIIQFPLPENFKSLINLIDPEKDIDALGEIQQGKMFAGENGFISCTAQGILMLLNYYQINLEGKNAIVVGRSNLVGKPLALLLLQSNASVTILHSKSIDMQQHVQRADIVFLCCGISNFLKKDWLTSNSIVIDVGITKKNGKIYGDLDQESYQYIKAYSPVPGGIGLMTVAALMNNVVTAYEKQLKGKCS